MTIKRKIAFTLSKGGELQWVPKETGKRRRPQLCRTKTVKEVKALAQKLRISLTKRVTVPKTKADLCASIARHVKMNSTPNAKKLSLRKYGYSLKSENKVRKPALNAAVKNVSRKNVAKRLTSLGRVHSKKNPVYSQRAFKNVGYVKKEAKPVKVNNNNNNNNNYYIRNSNSNSNKTNISELNNALNRIKKGGRLTAIELANLGNKLTKVQKKRWNSVVNNFNTGNVDPLSNEEFRRLRSRYSKK